MLKSLMETIYQRVPAQPATPPADSANAGAEQAPAGHRCREVCMNFLPVIALIAIAIGVALGFLVQLQIRAISGFPG